MGTDRTPLASSWRGGRNGVALVIVLGLISILMIMGVAFSVSMRVERMSAGSFRFGINSRNMVWAGLARAVDAINTVTATNGGVYPNWEVLPSAGPGGGVRVAFGDSLMYVQAGLTNTVQNADSHWIIGASQGGGTDDGSLQGRVAYLIVNQSGFLDAHVAGGSNRWAGAGPREISLTNLSDVADVGTFDARRTNPHKRYETLHELSILQSPGAGGGLRTSESATPSNFVVYSRAAPGYMVGTNVSENVLDIGGTAVELAANRAAIISQLTSAGIAGVQAHLTYSNLIDYVDSDWVPQDLMACVETVPMLNEIIPMAASLSRSGANYRYTPSVLLELFYPFIAPVNDTFSLRATLETKLHNERTGLSSTATRTTTTVSGYVANNSVQWYRAIPYPASGLGGMTIAGEPGDHIAVMITLVSAEVLDSSGQVVDCVPFPTNVTSDFTFSNSVVANDSSVMVSFKSLECIDPRLNWRKLLNWGICTSGTGNDTRNAQNAVTTDRLAFGQTNPGLGLDWDTKMYGSNRGRLLSVGELGNLQRIAQAYMTVRLFDHTNSLAGRLHPVLNVFTIGAPGVKRGLVNPNTTNPEVLKAVLSSVPLGYPESGNILEGAELDGVVSAYIGSSMVFTNLADIGRLNFRTILPGRSDVERESIIAYSCGLLNTRQSLFTIFVAAGPFSPGLGIIARRGGGASGDWLGYQRAVFEVWRDPFPNAQGRYPCFVRTFKWLDGGD